MLQPRSVCEMVEWYMFIFICIPLTWCLRVVDVQVPSLVDIKDKATLVCKIELSSAGLYSLKWYKDELEFFRYTPTTLPPIQTFPVDGINITESKNMTVVTLSPLSYKTTGVYKCEVSTEGPHFRVSYKTANMTVLGIPKEKPLVEGIKPSYSIGDFVNANCTSSPSNPPATIEWLINGHKAEHWYLLAYKGSVVEHKYLLETRKLGLRFQVDNGHFLGKDGILSLTCRAVVDRVVKQHDSIAQLAQLNNLKYAQEHLRNGGSPIRSTRLDSLTFQMLILCYKLLT